MLVGCLLFSDPVPSGSAQPLEEAEATLTSMAELSLVIAEVLLEGLMEKVSFHLLLPCVVALCRCQQQKGLTISGKSSLTFRAFIAY